MVVLYTADLRYSTYAVTHADTVPGRTIHCSTAYQQWAFFNTEGHEGGARNSDESGVSSVTGPCAPYMLLQSQSCERLRILIPVQQVINRSDVKSTNPAI